MHAPSHHLYLQTFLRTFLLTFYCYEFMTFQIFILAFCLLGRLLILQYPRRFCIFLGHLPPRRLPHFFWHLRCISYQMLDLTCLLHDISDTSLRFRSPSTLLQSFTDQWDNQIEIERILRVNKKSELTESSTYQRRFRIPAEIEGKFLSSFVAALISVESSDQAKTTQWLWVSIMKPQSPYPFPEESPSGRLKKHWTYSDWLRVYS